MLFALTWVTYLSVEPALKRLKMPVLVFFIGHSLVAALLISLVFIEMSGANLPFVIAWISAGFGGGTVFTITEINKQTGCFEKNSETIAENFGHIFGAGTAALCAFFIGEQAPAVMALTAALSAVCTIAAMIFVRRTKCRSTQ